MQKLWKEKIPKKRFVHFRLWLKNGTDSQNLDRQGNKICWAVQKKLCKAEGIHVYSAMGENKAAFVERLIRSLKLICYRYTEDFEYTFIHNFSSRRNRDLQRQLLDRLDRKECQVFRLSVNSVQQATTRIKMIYSLGRFTSQNLHKKILKLLQFFPKNFHHTQQRMNKLRLSVVNFIKKVDRSHLWMESFTKGLVSNASAHLFPDSTLSCFTDFLPEQLHLKGQCEVAVSEISYPSMYQNVTVGNFTFFDIKNFQSRLNFTICNPVSTFPLRILLKPWTLSFKKNPITARVVSQLECPEERKKSRFTLQMKNLVLHSFVRKWATFLEVILSLILK